MPSDRLPTHPTAAKIDRGLDSFLNAGEGGRIALAILSTCDFNEAGAVQSAAKPVALSFNLQGLLAAIAVFGAALAMLKWSLQMAGPCGLVCLLFCLCPCALVGGLIERTRGRRGLAGGACGAALPVILFASIAEGADLTVSLPHGVLLALYSAVCGAVVVGLYSLAVDGRPQHVLSRFFYWNWLSVAPISSCAVVLFSWSRIVAPYQAMSIGGLTGEVRNEGGAPKYFVYYDRKTVLIRRDRSVEYNLSATRYYVLSFLLVSLGLLSLRVLHAFQTAPSRSNEPVCAPATETE